MRTSQWLLGSCALLFPVLLCSASPPASDAALTRDFVFTYEATVTGLQPGQRTRIWLPVPPSNEDQQATIVAERVPGKPELTQEPEYGDRMMYTEAVADAQGRVPMAVTYRIARREVKADLSGQGGGKENVDRLLKPDALVPIDGKPQTLIRGKDLPRDQLDLGRFLYDLVDAHMRYSKEGTGWGRGDAVWACDSRYGNCSDFHSLFIALARCQRIPAKFEIGFPLPQTRGQGDIAGYHCWAKFKPEGKGWVPVDISEANKDPSKKDYYFGNLGPNRVSFSTGRDITLSPRQDGPPLNFFVYPYVEVDGRPYPLDKVERRFAYRDLEPAPR
jgi:transglutaminase-like putative cysteine protease